jgi:hypothetical protein
MNSLAIAPSVSTPGGRWSMGAPGREETRSVRRQTPSRFCRVIAASRGNVNLSMFVNIDQPSGERLSVNVEV